MGTATVRGLKDLAGKDAGHIRHHKIKINGNSWYDGVVVSACILLFFLLGFFSGMSVNFGVF